MKYAALFITLTLAALRVYFVCKNGSQPGQKASFPMSMIAQITGHATPDAGPAPKPVAATAPKPAATPAQKPGAADLARQGIDAQLKTLKVSSILPGQPGLAIIDKQSYAEGDDFPLKGHKAQITRVDENGITLTADGQTFHLDPPAAPDLAASRKPPR